MRIEGFIIHLARATQRQAQAERLRQALPVQSRIVDAVDGETLGDSEIASVYRRHIYRPHYPFELRKAEIGCFLSHRKVWGEIVDGGFDAGLIVEDDIEIDYAKLDRLLDIARSGLNAGDFLRFPQKANETGRNVLAENGMAIIEPRHVGLGMVMQLVGRDAATALLETTEQFDRPVDTTLQHLSSSHIRMLSSQPVCVREISAAIGGSTIQKKSKPVSEIISREVKRAMYKMALKIARFRQRV